MSTGGLTDKQVRHAKAGPKRVEIPAGSGLYLVVHAFPSTKKSWMLRYRYRGRTRGLTFPLGYPEMGLGAARAEAEAKLKDLANDIDPAVTQAVEVKEATPESVKAVAEEWLKRYVIPNTKPKSATEFERILRAEILTTWKDKLITEITKPDILRLLDKIVDRGAPIAANRTHEVIRMWLNWCVERGYLANSPAAGIRPPSVEHSRERVLTPEELVEVWTITDELSYPHGPFFRFLILTAQRRNEVSRMRWRDVDLDRAMWTLPPEATKAGRVHDVPLSPAAVEVLEGLPRFVGGDFIFSSTGGRIPINGFSKMKKRIDAATLKRRKDKGIDTNIPDWTLHDVRRTVATHLASSGVAPHILGALLNHTPGSTQGITSIYNRFRYVQERREALERWAEYVASLMGESRVVSAAG